MLLLLSREFFIFQIADVHLLHSATWWRLLGQKYSVTAEVTRLRLRGKRLAVWCGNETEPHYGRVAQTTGSQTKRERSPFAARSSRKLGQNAVRWSAFVLLRPGTGRAPALGQHALTSAATIWTILQRAMAGSAQANSRVCFAVSFFRLDHSFRGGEFFKGGRLPQAHGPFARARQIVAVRRKS